MKRHLNLLYEEKLLKVLLIGHPAHLQRIGAFVQQCCYCFVKNSIHAAGQGPALLIEPLLKAVASPAKYLPGPPGSKNPADLRAPRLPFHIRQKAVQLPQPLRTTHQQLAATSFSGRLHYCQVVGKLYSSGAKLLRLSHSYITCFYKHVGDVGCFDFHQLVYQLLVLWIAIMVFHIGDERY